MRLLICYPPLRGSPTPVLVRPASPLIARCAVALTHQPITPCWTFFFLLLNLGDMTLYIQRMACFACLACPASCVASNLVLLQAKAEHCSIKRASYSGRSLEVREALE